MIMTKSRLIELRHTPPMLQPELIERQVTRISYLLELRWFPEMESYRVVCLPIEGSLPDQHEVVRQFRKAGWTVEHKPDAGGWEFS